MLLSFCTLVASLGYTTQALAQAEGSAFTVTGNGLTSTLSNDYQCLGLNPANLGIIRDKQVHIGLLEVGAGIFSTALNREQLRKFYRTYLNSETYTTSQSERIDLAKRFAEGGISMNLDVTLIGLSAQFEKIGGFAFNFKQRASFLTQLNPDLSDLAFNGYNSSYFDRKVAHRRPGGGYDTTGYKTNPQKVSRIADGSKIQMAMWQEYNFGYGRMLLNSEDFKLSVGVEAKIIESYAIMDVRAENDELISFISMNDQYSIAGVKLYEGSSTRQNTGFIGNGFGFGFGGTAQLKKITVALAVNNIGSVTYDGYAYKIRDAVVDSTRSRGFSDYDLSNYDSGNDGDNLFKREDNASKYVVKLPASLRLGAHYEIAKNLVAGVDIYAPLTNDPGKLSNGIFTVGAQYKVGSILTLNAGVGRGTLNRLVVPIGFVFRPGNGTYELGLASRDIITFISNDNPSVSAAFGFLRFGLFNADKK